MLPHPRDEGLAGVVGVDRPQVGLDRSGALDLAERTGSLEPGKDADFIVLSGDPLSVYTQVLETWVEGEKVFDRARPEDRLAAEGGWGAGTVRREPIACFDEEMGR